MAMMPRTLNAGLALCVRGATESGGSDRMHRHLRWVALLMGLLLVLAACQPGGGAPGESQPTSDDPCEADEFGCYEVGEGEPILIGTALVITGPDAALGLDSQYGAVVAGDLKNADGGVLGHEI